MYPKAHLGTLIDKSKKNIILLCVCVCVGGPIVFY
jgi:hypothetical protein